MTTTTSFSLRRRIDGAPHPGDFAPMTSELGEPGPGQLRLRTLMITMDPGMRSTMRSRDDYRYVVGDPLIGRGLAQVEDSGVEGIPVGALVRGWMPWAEGSIVEADAVEPCEPAAGIALASELSALWVSGLVAYVGMLDFGVPAAGEEIFISSAAGPVGSMAGQIARLRGARVIGSTTTARKLEHVRALGFAGTVDYRADLRSQLRAAFPTGIDIYYDNVGGAQLQAAFDRLRRGGRAVMCGSVSEYNDDEDASHLTHLRRFVTHGIRMQGFTIWNHLDRAADHRRDMSSWLRSGEVIDTVHVVDGLGEAPPAFCDMLAGRHLGKTLVRVADPR